MMHNFNKMEFKIEFINAVKLFFLLILLFWIFTWNSDPNLDFSSSRRRKIEDSKFPKDAVYVRSESSVVVNRHSVLMASVSTVQYGPRKSSMTTTGLILPPFNEWKEAEKIKYEKAFSKDGNIQHHHKKGGQRKLNYASSKCGAKILASNPEAKYRISILNEKPDEYMLNPCRVKTWFVIELCDTVEATQIDIANYELYSSSPREFSVFWSEVYPTHVWHLLGTFEAKDQRTMQTFYLNSKNLGKFIKVVVYSHHGKEHYCPMSVIRVLGYSMVEKFEDMEETDESTTASGLDNQHGTQTRRNLTSREERIFKENIKLKSDDAFLGYSNGFSVKLCEWYFLHCSHEHNREFEMLCPNEPICRFFMEILPKFSINCDSNFCSIDTTVSLNGSNATYAEEQKKIRNLANYLFPWNVKSKQENHKTGTMSTNDDILKEYTEKPFGQGVSISILKEMDVNDNSSKTEKSDVNKGESFVEYKNFSTQDNRTIHKMFNISKMNNGREKCICESDKQIKEKMKKINKDSSSVTEFEQELSDIEKEVDSAGLIQKESVLFKLTARIKASETDLNLINEYLQQLSQSYRWQMEDMQVMFNQTVTAINEASEKAIIIDQKQETSITTLQQKVASLTRKVDYLMNGQRDMLKRVVEMHAFFLILEFIIISTIFTIFLNIFQRKNASIMYRISKS